MSTFPNAILHMLLRNTETSFYSINRMKVTHYKSYKLHCKSVLIFPLAHCAVWVGRTSHRNALQVSHVHAIIFQYQYTGKNIHMLYFIINMSNVWMLVRTQSHWLSFSKTIILRREMDYCGYLRYERNISIFNAT